jgi:di/tricarboxylate transporter
LDEFLFDVKVAERNGDPGSGGALLARRATLAGQTVEEAGLRDLGDAYLVHIERDGHLVQASPEEVLQNGDTLTFTGRLSILDDLLARPGLERAVPSLDGHAHQTLPLYEAVVADSSRLVGKTLREADFRDRYQGVVLGIQRKDERIDGPLGRTPVQTGDLLIVEAQSGFDERFGPGRGEFYLTAPRREGRQRRASGRAPVAAGLLVGMIGLNVTGLVPLVVGAFLAALGMVLTGCLSLEEAGESVSLPVLIVIASALGLGQAIEATGLAGVFAHGLVGVAAGGRLLAVLAAVYVATNVLTELITNNAAAVLMLPVALATASDLGASPRAFAIVVAIAASASFITPLGYHTNLMVMSPGGYGVRDYLRAGWPVSLLVMAVTLAAVWAAWL